jgi:hypothetical protein
LAYSNKAASWRTRGRRHRLVVAGYRQTLSTQTNFPMVFLMYMHPFETKAITNVNLILIQNNCVSLYANKELKTMNERIRKGKLKRTHVFFLSKETRMLIDIWLLC